MSPSRSRGSALIASSSVARPDASSSAPAMSKRCSRACAAGLSARQPAQQQEAGQRDRRAEPEHRGPAPMLDQRAADQRSARRADREHQREDAEGVAAPRFRIQARDQRRGAADDQPGPDPLQKTEEQQRAETRRRRAQQKRRDVPGQPGAEHAGMSPDVADPPEGEHQPGMGQHIADDDPLDHRDRQAEAAGDIGEGDVDRGVERHHRDAETERDEAQQRRRSRRSRAAVAPGSCRRAPVPCPRVYRGRTDGDKSRKDVASMNEAYSRLPCMAGPARCAAVR